MRIRLLLCLCLTALAAHSQEFRNTLSCRSIASDHYFRVNYENDLFFRTDQYYTQGVHFELVSPGIGRWPVRFLFPRAGSGIRRYGIGLESAGYTPTSILADSILYGDRPFAGMAYGKLFMMSVDTVLRSRLSAVLSLGLMGPAAGGYEIQGYIHRHTGSPDPAGWKYQVGNEAILNYELHYERALSPSGRPWLLIAHGMARAGTLSTKASLGIMIIAGSFADPFLPADGAAGGGAFLYAHPQLELVGYDATLQGGLLSGSDPYVISGRDIERLVIRFETGIGAAWGRFRPGLNIRYLTREFRSGRPHLTGGFQIGLRL